MCLFSCGPYPPDNYEYSCVCNQHFKLVDYERCLKEESLGLLTTMLKKNQILSVFSIKWRADFRRSS